MAPATQRTEVPPDSLTQRPRGPLVPPQLARPRSPRMNRIPRRFHAVIPILPRIMIAKPVQHHVPNRLEPIDQHGLAPANPLFLDDQVAAIEVPGMETRNPLGVSHPLSHPTGRLRLRY